MDQGITKMYERESDPENNNKKTMEDIQDEIENLYNKAKKKAKELLIQKIIEQHKLNEEQNNENP